MRQLPSLVGTVGAMLVCAASWFPAVAQEPPASAAPPAAKSPEKATPRPVAVIAQPIVDLGEVAYGEAKALEFVVKNAGDAPLRIHGARSGCSCVVMDFTPEIAPGAEGRVSVRFDAALSGGPTAVPIDVTSNDPDSPTMQLTVKADIKYHIAAVPGFVRYVVVQDFEADSTIKQSLWSTDGSPMRVTKVETPYEFIEASFREAKPDELPKDTAAKQVWLVETRISPKARIGALTGFLTIHVDHPKQTLLKLPLHGFVRPMFAVTPDAADWGDLKMTENGIRASVMVKNYAVEKVVVTGAETTVAGITTEIEEVDPGRAYWVRIKYPPDMPKGPFSGVLRIKTESPKRPLIEVPLRGAIL